ncbi:MAG: transketolase C-terminal domain-containing protein, partial [Flavobacteriales bacterium]
VGHIGNSASDICDKLTEQEIYASHYDLRFVKPLDEVLLHEIFTKFNKILTVEDGCIIGGMGSSVLEFMADNEYNANVRRMGVPDKVIEHGSQEEQHEECGIHPEGIFNAALELVNDEYSEISNTA